MIRHLSHAYWVPSPEDRDSNEDRTTLGEKELMVEWVRMAHSARSCHTTWHSVSRGTQGRDAQKLKRREGSEGWKRSVCDKGRLGQVLRESVCWAKELELHPEAKGGGQFPPWLRWRDNIHSQSLVLEKLSQSSQLEPSGRPHSCLLSEAGSGIEQEPRTSARRLLQESR